MQGIAVDSPLRRSEAFMARTPIQRVQQNDDEAERQARRSYVPESDDSTTISDNANLKMYLQMYTDNKLNKDNAWDVNVIDSFCNLLEKHHKSLTNFQVVGSSLEASAKVYALRVDSLHTDTLRMASELSRQAARKAHAVDDDDEPSMNDSEDKENENQGGENQEPRKKKRAAKRQVATITRNKETINAKLDTNPFTDPFFAQLNSIVGDINASNRLMQNMIPTKDGELRLRMDYPCWDPKPHEIVEFKEDDDYGNENLFAISVPSDISERHALHQRLRGYRMSDTPAEDDEEPEPDPEISNHSLNASVSQGAAVVFDPNAEVEQVPDCNDYVIDFDGGFDEPVAEGAVDFEELTTEDREAIRACRGLRREPVIIEDMRPVDSRSAELEYSYRPLDMISQFWAGPSHWKYRRLRSSVRQPNLATPAADANEAERAVAAKKRAPRKKRFEAPTFEAIMEFETDVFVKRDPKAPLKNITLTKAYISRKWNRNKLKLPTHLELSKDMFTAFTLAPSINLRAVNPENEPEIPVDGYNYENVQDKEYCSQINIETDAETDTEFTGEADHHNNSDEYPVDALPAPNMTLDVIPTEFAGAPDQVNKIIIPYAKRAKPVDMKQLKSACWRLTSSLKKVPASQSEGEEPMETQAVTRFNEIYNKLPSVLSKSMAENISVGLVFYSLLHLANEEGLELMQQSDLEDLTILLNQIKDL